MAGWDRKHVAKHAVPMLSGHACLVRCHMASRGYARLCVALVLQQIRGLRPSEVLALMPEDISFSHQIGGVGPARADSTLGARINANSYRAQNVALYYDTDPDVGLALQWIVAATPPHRLLFPHSVDTYRRLVANTDTQLRIFAGWTPHSPRAGFAKEATSNRRGFVEIKEIMRDSSYTSLRSYIDVVGAKAVAVNLLTAGLSPALSFSRVHWLKYVRQEVLAETYSL